LAKHLEGLRGGGLKLSGDVFDEQAYIFDTQKTFKQPGLPRSGGEIAFPSDFLGKNTPKHH